MSTLEFIDKYKLGNITYGAKIEFAGEAADTCRMWSCLEMNTEPLKQIRLKLHCIQNLR